GNVVAVSAGDDTSLFLKSDGSLWSMGYNGQGELGIGSHVFMTNTPQEVLSGSVFAFSCGAEHGLFVALPGFGRMSAMGDNEQGQLGDGTGVTTNRPIQLLPSGVIAVSAGGHVTLFIKSDGTLWGMGDDTYGQ